MRSLEDRALLLLVGFASIAFIALLWPFYRAILWAAVIAVVFAPLFRRLSGWIPGRPNLAALLTLLIILSLVIVPALLIGAALTREGLDVVGRLQSGELDVGKWFEQMLTALPGWASGWLDRVGVSDIGDIQAKLSMFFRQASRTIASEALNVGQSTFDFLIGFGVMLYLLFFLLRDGHALSGQIRKAVPLPAERRRALFQQFVLVVRATAKGNLLVAAAQGVLGGLMFWYLGLQPALLWTVLMAIAALVPAIGAALIWAPVALYLTLAGPLWKGLLLIGWGVLVIGLVDNLLRPVLVGKDTRMPDYVVLISTLGGLSLFGASGFIVGPAVAALFIASWRIFAEERRGRANSCETLHGNLRD